MVPAVPPRPVTFHHHRSPALSALTGAVDGGLSVDGHLPVVLGRDQSNELLAVPPCRRAPGVERRETRLLRTLPLWARAFACTPRLGIPFHVRRSSRHV